MERLESRCLLAVNVPLVNSGFESVRLAPWVQHGAAPVVSLVTDTVYAGSKSALVQNRIASDQGIARYLPELLQDQDYEISIWVRRKAGTGPVSDDIRLQIIVEDGRETRYVNIATEQVDATAWVNLKGGFRIEPGIAPTLVQMDITAKDARSNFYVDQLQVKAVDWRTAANDRIERFRKRNAVLHVVDANGSSLSATSIEVRQVDQEFGFGAALDDQQLANPSYTNFFKDNFKWATAENAMKWRFNESTRDVETFGEADALVNFTESNGIKLRGHNLLWGADFGAPDWVRSPSGASLLSASALQGEVNERLRSIVTRYRGKPEHWDVINESLDIPFFQQILGPNTNADTFRKAATYDPNAVLFTNEFGIIDSAANYGDEYRAFIQNLLATNTPVGGIGVEAHLDRGISSTAIQLGLQHLTDLGLPIWLTEFDVLNSDVANRAADLELFYRTAFSIPQVEGVVMWGFWAGSHWRGPDAALVNEDWSLNAAGSKYFELMNEWTTKVNGTGSSLAFRGFHGTYEATITLADGTVQRQTFTLGSDSSTTLHVSVGVSSIYTVITTADSGPGSLRSAIDYANATAGKQTIAFRLSGTGPFLIQPTTPLPRLLGTVVVDGASQPGYSTAPLVIIDGSLVSVASSGLILNASSSVIEALSIVGFNGDGIDVRGNDNVFNDNYIGILPSGMAKANGKIGIYLISGLRNVIGTPSHGNVVSGNAKEGIRLAAASSQSVLKANYVGLNPTGSAAIPNGTNGITVLGPSNVIGGVGILEANVVSGNTGSGIYGGGAAATLNLLQGNRIGTDRNGGIRIPNRAHGVSLSAPGNTVTSNVIASDINGVHLGAGAIGNQISQNFVGTDLSQTKSLNNQVGIYVVNSASSNSIIENVIANNGVGILAEPNALQNRISRNLFHSNVGIAIDLNGNGPTANDTGDVDSGANGLQNFPVVVSATLTNTISLNVRYRLDSATSASSYPLIVEFFIDDGAGEGRIYLGRGTLTAPNLSVAGKSLTLSVSSTQWPPNPRIVATATDSLGNSSEFSNPFSLAVPPPSLAALSAPDVPVSSQYDVNGDGRVTALGAGNKRPVPFVQSTRRASPSQKVPNTYFPLIANQMNQQNRTKSLATNDWDLALMAVLR